MASLIKIAKTGAYRIKFYTGGENTETVISLGKLPKKTVELILSRVETILACNFAGQPLPPDVAAWTSNISDDLHRKLVKAGLLAERQRRTLGEFISQYIAERTDWKPSTQATFRTSADFVIDYFGADTPLTKITAEQAALFRAKLAQSKNNRGVINAEAYVARIIKQSKQVFNTACDRGLIEKSPFAKVKAGSQTNEERLYFVSIEETNALIEACTSPKQRLIIALARYGGLRVQSEIGSLKWSKVDWGGITEDGKKRTGRFTVHCKKTEHHHGKAERIVPIFPELVPFFREEWENSPEGVDEIFPEIAAKTTAKSLGSFIKKTAVRAGIALWVRPFQNMRSTRETELIEAGFKEKTVHNWIGHSEKVANRHYIQTTEADFDKAGQKKVQECAHEPAIKGQNSLAGQNGAIIANPNNSKDLQRNTTLYKALPILPKLPILGQVGLEPTT